MTPTAVFCCTMLDLISITLKIIFIVFFFGFCVFIHEFGHLLAAIWQGLHVEKFSVGMGPRLWGFKYRGIDFIISALPFGGYVSLPQLDPTDAPQSSAGKPLPHASPKARAITAFAGPLFNVIFGFVLATVMWAAGLWRDAPANAMVVSNVPPFLAQNAAGDSIDGNDAVMAVNGVATARKVPGLDEATWDELGYLWPKLFDIHAAVPEELELEVRRHGKDMPEKIRIRPQPNPEWVAGLRAGDRITAINGKHFTRGTDEFRQEYLLNDKAHITLTAIRDGKELDFTYSPASNPATEGLGYPFFIYAPPLTVGRVRKSSPAWEAGVREGDQLLSVNGRNVTAWRDLSSSLSRLAGQQAVLSICRNGNELTLPPLTVPAEAADKPQQAPEITGLGANIRAAAINAGSPAEKAGLRPGDTLMSIAAGQGEAQLVNDMQTFIDTVASSKGEVVTIGVRRNGHDFSAAVKPTLDNTLTPPRHTIGIMLSDSPGRVLLHVDPWTQFSDVISQTTRTLGLLFSPLTSGVRRAVTGQTADIPQNQVGLKHMSGPGGILMMLWFRLQSEGYRGGFAFIILITFSLAFMNLLPLPVLDGGHIVFAGIEALLHRRLPARAFTWLYNSFAVLLIALMVYITFYDGKRFLKYTRHQPAGAPAAAPAKNAPPPSGVPDAAANHEETRP